MRIWVVSLLLVGCAADGGEEGRPNDGSDDGPSDGAVVECGDGKPAPGELCFHEPSTLEVEDGGAVWLSMADGDGDGDLDLVVVRAQFESFPDGSCCNTITSVGALLNDGQGDFEEGPRFEGGASLAVDVNGDEAADLLALEYPNQVGVRLNAGEAEWDDPVLFTVGDEPKGLAAGDLDGDGDLDLATYNQGSEDFTVLHGDGDGAFEHFVDLEASWVPVGVAIADLDGRGGNDLITSVGMPAGVTVYLSAEDGSFDALPAPADFDPYDPLRAGDVTADGAPDLVQLHPNAFDVDVWVGKGDGEFERGVNAPVGLAPNDIQLADFGQDGILDVITLNADRDYDAPGSVSILLAEGDGWLAPEVRFPTEEQPVSLAVGDLNGDDAPDVACASQLTGKVTLLLSNP